MSWEEKQGVEYRNQYKKEKYDVFQLVLPKGKREEYKAYASSIGKSLSTYINELIEIDIKKVE